MTTIILALIIGAAFGAVLDRIGATNPSVLINMLALRSLTLMKAILLAIGTAAILIFAGQMVGLVDVAHMSVKTAYWGVLVGGMLLGFGWAITGFCPGTGVCAAASGRRDAMVYIVGGLLGAAAYALAYAGIKDTGLLDAIWGGKVTLGAVPGLDGPALLPGMRGDVLGIVMGALFVIIAFALPGRPGTGQRAKAVPAE
ncbi:YeeE/YedE thiosulfate transporter family protein [Pararhodobacter sp.]|uniref:YeeE/YedE thiosulfate transporter family protein n=1 Tax=Pararhodobacter sp. TaxID=2127056 RepID=UPI002AFDE92F|nr:YeeE/YedE thiosulfate transporter family protein [Pararhodobacter sp.]